MSILLLSQRNRFLDCVTESRFSPADFEWRTSSGSEPNEGHDTLNYRRDTAFAFVIWATSEGWAGRLSPGDYAVVENWEDGSFQGVLLECKRWLDNLTREVTGDTVAARAKQVMTQAAKSACDRWPRTTVRGTIGAKVSPVRVVAPGLRFCS